MSEPTTLPQTVDTTDPMAVVPTAQERRFALSQREAKALASSDLVPTTFRENVPNCLIAMNLANRIGADPLMVMQNLYVIHGRPSFSASFLIACVNMCGRFTPLQYRIEGEGMARTCVAFACDKETGVEIEGPPVSIQMAKDEGWSTKSGSKWKTMPELMLRYRAAAFFARTVAPEITMGLHTADELEDIESTSRGARAEESVQSAAEAIERAKDVTPDNEELAPEYDPDTGEVIPDDIGQEPLL
jgi:hypothetical protein